MFQPNKLLYHLGQLYAKYNWPVWHLRFRPPKDRIPQNKGGDKTWILDQLDLGGIRMMMRESAEAAKNL